MNEATKSNKDLADVVWRTWGSLYGNGYYCDKEEVAAAISAYNSLGYEGFSNNSNAVNNRREEAIANLLCQAARHGLQPSVESPEKIYRMVKALRLGNTQWTTGGVVGNILFGIIFWLSSADYRWFAKLDR